MGPKTMDCVSIGYAINSKACLFFIHKSEHMDIHDNTVMESDNVEFFEHIYSYKTRLELSSERSNRPREEPKENVPNEESPKRSKHQRTSTLFGSDFITFFFES